MGELPFSIDLIRFLADARSELLTKLFLFFTFLGEVGGFVLLITLIYVTWDKRLAFRLAALTLVTMSLNHLLKMLIMNPRPFVADGSYVDRWAVSRDTAIELATEYSTPSGHAMAGSAFYVYLFASLGSRPIRIVCVLLIVLVGLSRPYLGVHYLEDVLIGWALGAMLALLALQHAKRISDRWGRLAHAQQIAAVAAASLALWVVTRAISGWSAPHAGQPLAFVSYVGFLMGIVVAHPLEASRVDFDPRSSTPLRKALRYVLCVALILGTLQLLDVAFAAISEDYSLLGQSLRYLRYALAGFAGMFLGPLLCVKLGWAEQGPTRQPEATWTSSRSRADSRAT